MDLNYGEGNFGSGPQNDGIGAGRSLDFLTLLTLVLSVCKHPIFLL